MSDAPLALTRIVLIMVPGSFIIMSTIVVIFCYAKVYMTERKVAKVQRRKAGGLLPLHVAVIATSYLIALTRDLVETVNRITHHVPINWWTVWWNFLEFTVGCGALWVLLRYERKRYQDVLANIV